PCSEFDVNDGKDREENGFLTIDNPDVLASDRAKTPKDIYILSLHDALPIWCTGDRDAGDAAGEIPGLGPVGGGAGGGRRGDRAADRKSTRLNSSHDQTSYAVFCLKKKTKAPRRRNNELDQLDNRPRRRKGAP